MTEVTLANMALRAAKLTTIDSLDDTNELASYIKEIFPDVIKEQLGEHLWGFARKTNPMTLLVDTFEDWAYLHDNPDDMVMPERYYPTGYNYKTQFLAAEQYEVIHNMTSADRASGRIASNEENLSIVYTKYFREIAYYPLYFAQALSYLLAYYLAQNFGGQERASWAYQMWSTLKLPWAIGKDQDRGRENVKGEATLTSETAVYDPWGFR